MILQDNIAAISTPPGVGGVAIIRISGEDPLSVLEKMFRPAGKTQVKAFEPYRLYPGVIEADGFFDQGMAVYFRSPHSYTGEDVVEIHCHGGIAIQRGVLQKTFSLGCRPAERGEFTRRAYLNGKMSLSSSEGLNEMIHAETTELVKAGYRLYREKLYNAIEKLRKDLTFTLAKIDAEIDFPEEGLEEVSDPEIAAELTAAADRLSALAETYRSGSYVKSGVRVALLGRPNTGKSSLLNAILGREKAIVTDVAGTTRDVVEGEIELSGIKFIFSDTAGLRNAEDAAEKIGVDLAKKTALAADVVLVLTEDADDNFTDEVIAERKKEGGETLFLVNKSDLMGAEARAEKVRGKYGENPLILSAKTGEGVPDLTGRLCKIALSGKADPEIGYLTERRHYEKIVSAKEILYRAANAVGTVTPDLIAQDIDEAWSLLGEITGATAPDEVIDEIFSKFCVGK